VGVTVQIRDAPGSRRAAARAADPKLALCRSERSEPESQISARAAEQELAVLREGCGKNPASRNRGKGAKTGQVLFTEQAREGGRRGTFFSLE
jgi:hypothetical protein